MADADPRKLALQLARAGANWAVLLRRAQRSGFQVPASKNAPLLGLMAIDDLTGAAELAQLSATRAHPLEYPHASDLWASRSGGGRVLLHTSSWGRWWSSS